MEVKVSVKNLLAGATVVGMGVTIGKYMGNVVVGFVKATLTETAKYKASKGSKFAQEVCEVNGLAYETKNEKNEE